MSGIREHRGGGGGGGGRRPGSVWFFSSVQKEEKSSQEEGEAVNREASGESLHPPENAPCLCSLPPQSYLLSYSSMLISLWCCLKAVALRALSKDCTVCVCVCVCLCAQVGRSPISETGVVLIEAYLCRNQAHLYRYSPYAAVFVPIYLCVFVPVINTRVCVSVCVLDDWDKAQRAGGGASLTLHSRWRACAWRSSRCRAGCAGRGAGGWWLKESGWWWRSIRTPPPGGAAPSPRRPARRCWPAGTRCRCACRCAGRPGTAWSVWGRPSKAHRGTGDTRPPQCGSSPWCSLRPLPPGQGQGHRVRVRATPPRASAG